MIKEIIQFQKLKDLHRSVRGSFDEEFSLRLHRGLSWLQRAEQDDDDPDASFIFLWIAFNSIYSSPSNDEKQSPSTPITAPTPSIDAAESVAGLLA